MDATLPFIYLLIVISIIWKHNWFNFTPIPRYAIVIFYLLKVFVGVNAGFFFPNSFISADAYNLFQSSQKISGVFLENPMDYLSIVTGIGDENSFMEKHGAIASWYNKDFVFNDNRTIIRINAVIGLFSKNIYTIHVIFFAFINLIGLIAIFKGLKMVTEKSIHRLIALVFLVPSNIFWLSIPAKESILVFAMGLFIYYWINIINEKPSFRTLTGFIISAIIFLHIKAYMLYLLIPAIIGFSWNHLVGTKIPLLKYCTTYVLYGFIIVFLGAYLNFADPIQLISSKRNNFEKYAKVYAESAKSHIELPVFNPNWESIVYKIPEAVSIVFIRPFVWEDGNLPAKLVAIENATIAIWLLLSIFFMKRELFFKYQNLILFCLFMLISTFALIGLTTPVLGAIVRYKAPILPFLWLLPFLIIQFKTKHKNNIL